MDEGGQILLELMRITPNTHSIGEGSQASERSFRTIFYLHKGWMKYSVGVAEASSSETSQLTQVVLPRQSGTDELVLANHYLFSIIGPQLQFIVDKPNSFQIVTISCARPCPPDSMGSSSQL